MAAQEKPRQNGTFGRVAKSDFETIDYLQDTPSQTQGNLRQAEVPIDGNEEQRKILATITEDTFNKENISRQQIADP